jgi:hypothetical protein
VKGSPTTYTVERLRADDMAEAGPLSKRSAAGASGTGAQADPLLYLHPPKALAERLSETLETTVTELERLTPEDLYALFRPGEMKGHTIAALGAHLSRALQKGFSEIDPAMAATLAEYGVDAARWEGIRNPSRHGAAPQPLGAEPPTAVIEAWLWDRVILVAMPAEEPIHERLLRGAADFTVEGELLRFMAQFRELRAPFPPKPHGTVAPREADQAILQALMRGDTLPALTSLLIWMVLFARLTRFGFDLAEGKAAPVRKGEWSWHDAAMAGGTLGLVADLLFGETTGLRVATLNTFATIDHPSIESALDIWRAARDGEDVRGALATWAKQEGDANALDTLQVTRHAMNAALLHQLQEMMSPGYLPRAAKEMQAGAADAYWRQPGVKDR